MTIDVDPFMLRIDSIPSADSPQASAIGPALICAERYLAEALREMNHKRSYPDQDVLSALTAGVPVRK